MQQAIEQTYRLLEQHIVQQQLAHREAAPRMAAQETDAAGRVHTRGMAWEMGGILALFAAATAVGVLAQAHLG